MPSSNLPAPFRGMDTKTPIAVLQNPYCQNLFNFNTTEAGIQLRHGDSIYDQMPMTGGVTTHRIMGIFTFNDTLIILSNTDLGLKYYIGNGGASIAFSANSTGSMSVSNQANSVIFAGYMFLFKQFGVGGFLDKYNGSAWSTIGYTGPTYPVGGCAYKNRMYIIEGALTTGSSDYYYSDINAITGAMTQVNIAGVLQNYAQIVILTPLTIGEGIDSIELFCIITMTGEVLFYSGSYPDGSDWGLVGRGQLPNVITDKIIRYNGDVLVITGTGLFSLRQLYFTGSDKAKSFAMSKELSNQWLIAAGQSSGGTYGLQSNIMGLFWSNKNKIVITFDNDTETGAISNSFFIYDTLLESWSIHQSSQFSNLLYNTSSGLMALETGRLIIAPSSIYANSDVVLFVKEGSTDFQDYLVDGSAQVSYDYEMISAPIPFPKTATIETSQIEPIIESDLYAETNWSLIADFGKQTTGNQTVNALTTAVQKPAANVGIQNATYVQVKLEGTTAADKTVGLDLYSYNIWYNLGQEGSR